MRKAFEVKYDDIVFDNLNNIKFVHGNDEIRQSVERILTTNIREWFLNIGFGLDYDAISGKGKDDEGIKLALREAIFQDDRIMEIEFLELSVDRQTRELTVRITATIEDGEVLEGIEVSI